MKIKYKIYNPSGNITALVIGDEYNNKEKELINNAIMKEKPEIEQVGFVSTEYRKLTMAGGEFCGNATRCAVKYYFNNEKTSKIEIDNKEIIVGTDKDEKIWCEIPIEGYEITKLSENIYKVKLEGITIIVINEKNVLIRIGKKRQKI